MFIGYAIINNMKKLVLISLLALLISSFPAPVLAEENANSSVAVSKINNKNGDEFIEIHNYEAKPIAVPELKIEVFNSNGNSNLTKTFKNKSFKPSSFVLIAQNNSTNSDEHYSSDSITPAGGKIEVSLGGQLIDEVCWGKISSCANFVTISENNVFATNRCQTDSNCANQTVRFGGLTDTPICKFDATIFADDEKCIDPNPPDIDPGGGDPPIPKDACANLAVTEIGANLDEQFIEITNKSATAINPKGCMVQTNRNQKQFVFGDEMLAPGAVRLVKISDTALTLSKTVSGTVYILSSDGQEEFDVVIYPAMKTGVSWWLIDGAWKESSKPSPGEANQIPPPNFCDGLKISEIGANLSEQFIEITNVGTKSVGLNGCQIMTNRSASKSFLFSDETLAPGNFKIIKIADTPLTLTKTTKGSVLLLSSDGSIEVDIVSYDGLAENTSWALVEGSWLQTYNLTPGQPNIYQEYPACEAGYYRNLETGRCKKTVAEIGLAACPAGQYRHPETNRCRKIAAASTLAACKPGYERNSETNRCRKIVTAADAKACAEGYERNPETNRCRKITNKSAAAFAVETGQPTGTGGSWLLAGLGVLGLTFGLTIWRFRMEITNFFRRFSAATTGR